MVASNAYPTQKRQRCPGCYSGTQQGPAALGSLLAGSRLTRTPEGARASADQAGNTSARRAAPHLLGVPGAAALLSSSSQGACLRMEEEEV